MNGGPIQRMIAVVGLVALAPIGYLLFTGELSLVEAGTRAGITFVAVMVVARIGGWGFSLMARSMEAAPTERRNATPQPVLSDAGEAE